MSQRIVCVDAFTDRPFAGNPAAVCVLDAPANEVWMRHVARELSLSETAFLHPEDDAWRLRWFTPAVEVDLCGHATLASAHVLWEDGRLAPEEPALFRTRSGELSARQRGGRIELDFPSQPPTSEEVPAELIEAIGTLPIWGGRNRVDWLLELDDENAVRRLAPNLHLLARLPARGVIVTARAQPDAAATTGKPGAERAASHDFVSRFFAPAVGVDEDPVTGSAHCCLAPYWAERLGREELTGYQASARGGIVRMRLRGERIDLIGEAVTVWRGELVA